MADEVISVKLVVVGDGFVGKTSILLSYIKDECPGNYEPTIFDNHSVVVKSGNRRVRLGLWDTAGQEEYGSLRPLAYTNCDIFLIVFSVVERSSFENAIKKWSYEIERCAPGVPLMFVGNKIDLREPGNPNHISHEFARKQINQAINSPYQECSAMTRQGLDRLFMQCIKYVLEKKKLQRVGVKGCCDIF